MQQTFHKVLPSKNTSYFSEAICFTPFPRPIFLRAADQYFCQNNSRRWHFAISGPTKVGANFCWFFHESSGWAMCQQEMEVEVTDADEDNELGGRAGDQGRLSCVDCSLQAPQREFHSNDVCGDPMDLAINMVIGSDDCFIGEQGSKRSRHQLELPANHISPSRDKHRQKHQRRKVIFYKPLILLIIGSHRAVSNRDIHFVCYSPSIA